MNELPQGFRDLLVEQLDEYLESGVEDIEAAALVSDILEVLQTVADDCDLEGDIAPKLEQEADLDEPLSDLLLHDIQVLDPDELVGEDLAVLLESICEIDWVDAEIEGFGVDELDDELDFDSDALDDLDDDY